MVEYVKSFDASPFTSGQKVHLINDDYGQLPTCLYVIGANRSGFIICEDENNDTWPPIDRHDLADGWPD